MAQIVKLRRSSVSGQKPTNTNLQLGELALNTTDGKVYMAKSGSLGPSVEELISTNTVNTGSISLTGDISGSIFTGSFKGDGSELYNIPLSGVTNLTTISGSFDDRLDALETLSQSYTGSISGSLTGSGYVDYLVFNSTSVAPLQSYMLQANTTDKTLDLRMGNDATLQLGQELYNPPVVNKSGGPLSNGDLVMINPAGIAIGNRIAVVKAVADGSYPAEYILGVLTEDIDNNQEGFATWFGYVRNISKTQLVPAGETWAEGDILYPNSTIPGKMTNIMPVAPNLKSTIGIISAINGNNVTIMVRMSLRGKLDTLHNVTVGAGLDGDLLVRSGSVWKNSKELIGNYAVTGSLTITQNLTVLGSSSLVYVTSSNLAVSASFISVNVFEPAERFGGLKVYDSGSSQETASLAWDSFRNHWVYQNVSGSNYSGAMLLSGPRNSGSLGDEPGLIDGRIVKSVGDDHIDVSIMSEVGNTINVAGHLNAYSLTGSLNFGDLTDLPTLVSSSSQIEITGTTGYSTFSGSISSSIGYLSSSFSTSLSEVSSSISSSIDSLSGSIATTTNDLGGRLDSIEGVTGSYATTGSNQFNGDQSISGSVIIGSGSLDIISPEILHVGNSGSYNIVHFDGYHASYAQINIQNHHSGSGASTDFVLTADNGSETNHYVDLGINSSNYDAGYVGYENDAYLINAGRDLYVGTIGGIGTPSNLNLFAQNNWENPQVHISSSTQIGFNTKNITSGYQYEFSGSIKANHSLDVIGSVSASVFTGSYIGDGFGLYNIPASGVTGLELFKITSGSVSASISPDRGLEVNTDVYIDGILTAKELHIDYVTSSVLYQSGSTKFGDTLDDNHNFTGSVNITGSLYLNGTIVGTGKLDETTFESYTSSIDPRISALETESGSIRSDFNTFTSSYTTGAFTGSFNGDATNLTNVPFSISGSDISGNTYNKTFTKLQFDDSTGLNVNETDPGTAFISIGSHFKDIFVSGSDILSATGSDAFEVIPEGGIDITTSITDTNGNGYIKELKFSTLNLSSSLDSRIEDISGSLDTLSGSLDTLSTTVVLTSQTGSMSVLSASFAATAAFALNAGGGVEGKSAKLTQSISASTWTFDHFLGERYPNVTVYDSNDQVVVPTYIEATSDTQLIIYFSIAQTGTAVATIGGGLPAISGSYEGRVLSVVGGAANWKDEMVSGSLQIEEFGYAITGSNTFVGDQVIGGTLSILDALVKHETTPTLTVGTNLVTEVAASVYDAAFFDYVVKDGTNMRAGTVMSVSNGSIVKYNETTTNDIGDTSPVTLSVTLGSGNIKLMATITSGTWTFSSLTRGI